MTIVMFALSLNVYKIFRNQEKFQNIDLENDGQVQGVQTYNLRHSTEMFDFIIAIYFQNICYLEEHVYANM